MPILIIMLTTLCIVFPASGQTRTILNGKSEGMAFQVEEIVSGQGVIWGLAFLSANRLLFTERQGNIKTVDPATGRIVRLQGAPDVWHKGQGGMLDAAVENGYTPGGWIYFTYSKNIQGKGATTLGRARLQEERLTDWQELLVTISATGTSRHFGSRIAFDGAGHLFFSVGDRGERPNGQDRSTHAGALAMTHLNRVVLDSNDRPVKEERLLIDLDERIRDVIENREGWLYISTDSGRILCIKPSSE